MLQVKQMKEAISKPGQGERLAVRKINSNLLWPDGLARFFQYHCFAFFWHSLFLWKTFFSRVPLLDKVEVAASTADYQALPTPHIGDHHHEDYTDGKKGYDLSHQ